MTARTKQELYDRFSSGGSAKKNISQRQQEFEDLIDSIGTATYTIAANDASTNSKSRADYQCDGTADDVEIQAAIDALFATGGGLIRLSEGTFSLDAEVYCKTKVSIAGSGFCTIMQIASGVSKHCFYIYDHTDLYVKDLACDLTSAGTSNTLGGSPPCGVFVGHTTPGTTMNLIIKNLYVDGPKEEGVIILSGDHIYILDNIIEDSVLHGIHTDNNSFCVIRGNIINNSTEDGIRLTNTSDHCLVADNIVNDNDQYGITIMDSNYCTVTGNVVKDSATANSNGIQLEVSATSACDFNTVVGNTVLMQTSVYGGINLEKAASNTIVGNNVTGSAAYGVRENGTGVDLNLIQSNYLSGTTAGVIVVGANTIVKDNIGYLSENSATASLLSGQTTLAVAHGLAATPTVINIAFREQGDNDYGRWWVSTIGATNFTLNVTGDPGSSNLDFAWEAKVR